MGLTLPFVLCSKFWFFAICLSLILVTSKELRMQHTHSGVSSCHTLSEHWWKWQLPKGHGKCTHLCTHCVQLTLPKRSRTIQFDKILCTSIISCVLKVNYNVPWQICLFHSLGTQPKQSNYLFLSFPLLSRLSKN